MKASIPTASVAGTPAERDALQRVSELAAQLSDELGRPGPLDE